MTDTPPVLPERTYWTTNAHGHMEISGVYVEALESAYAKAVEFIEDAAGMDCISYLKFLQTNACGVCFSCRARDALRSLPKVPK